jgi:hypothetical protein
MEQLPEMDPEKYYEWMVIENRKVVRTGRPALVIKSSCITEDIIITDDYWLGENGECPALADRYTRLNGANIHAHGTDALGKGQHFFAKVFPIFISTKNGRVEYIFNYASHTTMRDNLAQVELRDNATQVASVRSWIQTMCLSTLTHKERLDKCAQQGSAYLKEFRKMQAEKVI